MRRLFLSEIGAVLIEDFAYDLQVLGESAGDLSGVAAHLLERFEADLDPRQEGLQDDRLVVPVLLQRDRQFVHVPVEVLEFVTPAQRPREDRDAVLDALNVAVDHVDRSDDPMRRQDPDHGEQGHQDEPEADELEQDLAVLFGELGAELRRHLRVVAHARELAVLAYLVVEEELHRAEEQAAREHDHERVFELELPVEQEVPVAALVARSLGSRAHHFTPFR